MKDDNFLHTLSERNWQSSFGPPISPRSVFGGIVRNKTTGSIEGAASIVLTYFLDVKQEERQLIIQRWERFWREFCQSDVVRRVFEEELAVDPFLQKIFLGNSYINSNASEVPTSLLEAGITVDSVSINRTEGTPRHLYYKVNTPSIVIQKSRRN